MAPRITIIGGGSYQWVPKLLIDVVNTPSLADAEIVLEDIDPAPLEPMAEYVRHVAKLKGVGITVSTSTDQRAALAGADYVVVTISTGGFDSMRHDLAIPEKYGIKQSVGDTVGPGGIMRALRNIPVLVGIARDMETVCDDAWLLNITNPMTTLCRAVTRETNVQCVGLCHEVTMAQFTLSQLLDAPFASFDFDVVGVNHLPLITGMRIDGEDAFPRLRELLENPARAEEIVYVPPEIVAEAKKHGIDIDQRKREVMQANQVKLRCFERFGALPAAGDRHLVEFFPGFLTDASEWGKRWGVSLTSIEDREADAVKHKQALDQLMHATEVPSMPSGEMVAPMIDAFLRDKPRTFPLNLPNAGQVLDLPSDVVVEAMVVADGSGLSPRDELRAPPLFAEWLRRIVSSQEATVEAALTGSRDKVAEAMVLDPLAGRIDLDDVWRMSEEMLTATQQWLPQFA